MSLVSSSPAELRAALGGGEETVFYNSDGGLRGGDQWLKRLQHEIVTRNVFVVVLSPEAFASPWVDQELSLAVREAVSNPDKVLVPVLHRPTPDPNIWPFLDNFQRVSFLPPHSFAEGLAEVEEAVRLGHARRAEHGRLPGRPLAPFDGDLLPLPERFIGRERALDWVLQRLAPETTAEAPVAAMGERARWRRGWPASWRPMGWAASARARWRGRWRILWATNRFPDGIAVVLCHGLSDPAVVLRRVLTRFLPEGQGRAMTRIWRRCATGRGPSSWGGGRWWCWITSSGICRWGRW